MYQRSDGEPDLRIVIDAVFFQIDTTGIARLWQALFFEWANTPFAASLLVLDRAGTWPPVAGIASISVPAYDVQAIEADSRMLQAVCDNYRADLFVSTYYTSPMSTPSIFMAYDMIPESTGCDLELPEWRAKHCGMRYATAAIAISRNTAKDLANLCQHLPLQSTTIAHLGIDPSFQMATSSAIERFRAKYGIRGKYCLTVGRRNDYKNGALLFKALARLPDRDDYEIVCVGGETGLDVDSQAAAGNDLRVHLLRLPDAELVAAYSGAVALAYPSRYEGFGLPPLEAMACGCPVITTRRGSLEEVCGEAAIYVDPDSVDEMIEAIHQTQQPQVRQRLHTAGIERARQYRWRPCADIVRDALIVESRRVKTDAAARLLKETRLARLVWQAHLQDSGVSDPLRRARARGRELLKATPVDRLEACWRGEWGMAARLAMICREAPPIDDESDPHPEIERFLQQRPPASAKGLLIAMLYAPADRLPRTVYPSEVPAWLKAEFTQYLFHVPLLFSDEHEGARYAHTLQLWLEDAEQSFAPNNPEWQSQISTLLNAMVLIGLLSVDRSLTELVQLRGRLIDRYIRQLGLLPEHSMAIGPPRPRVRLGVLVEPLSDHPSSHASLALLGWLDRSLFEVIVYSRTMHRSPQEFQCRQLVDRLSELPPSLSEAVLFIRRDDLDGLIVDIDIVSQFTPMVYLAAHRLARLQISTHAACGATGLKSFDAILIESKAEHATVNTEYREHVIRVDAGIHLRARCNRPSTSNVELTRSVLGISERAIVYGSGASVHKLSPQSRRAFIEILSKTSDSVLLLFPFAPGWTNEYPVQSLLDKLRLEFAENKLDPVRLQIVRPLANRDEAMAMTRQCDIYLDAFPHTGRTSLLNPIEAGVPIVAMEGLYARSRSASSILQELSLQDWIVGDRRQYVARAIALGNDSALRRHERLRLEAAVSHFLNRRTDRPGGESIAIAVQERLAASRIAGKDKLQGAGGAGRSTRATPAIQEPILFLIYNRPAQTRQAFESLRLVKPRSLYVAADGPKTGKVNDEKFCQEARGILDEIDWECEVRTLLRPTNLGCRQGVSTAIDWFFQHVESGIILEDDCVASASFFTYCEELLERYRDDRRIMTISGNNFQFGNQMGNASYYFSAYSHIWGWATWRRAWQLYDVELKTFPEFRRQGTLGKIANDLSEQNFWHSKFESVYRGEIDTWDYQWLYAHFYYQAFSVTPNVNLVTNIGINDSGTHTRNTANPLANLPRGDLECLVHPDKVARAIEADDFTRRYIFRIG